MKARHRCPKCGEKMQRPARRCGFCLEQATGRSLTPPVPGIKPPSTRANRENVAYMRAGTVRASQSSNLAGRLSQ